MDCITSNFFCMVKFRKLVSTRTEYGGRRAVLNWKKREEETCGL